MKFWERHIKLRVGITDQSDQAVAQYGEGGTVTFQSTFEYYWPAGKRRYIEIHAVLTDDVSSNQAEVKIWNVSDESLEKIYNAFSAIGMKTADSESDEVDSGFIPWMEVYLGYGDWCPLYFTGKIKGLPTTQWQSADTVTVFKLVDDVHDYLPQRRAHSTYPPGTMHSDIVKHLLKELGLPLGAEVQLGVDFPTKDGVSYSPDISIRNALSHEAEDTESVFFVSQSMAYFVPKTWGNSGGLTLTEKNGLIWTAKPIHKPQWGENEDVQYTSLVNPILKPRLIHGIKSGSFSGSVSITQVEVNVNKHDYYFICKSTIQDEEQSQKALQDAIQAKLQELQKGGGQYYVDGNTIKAGTPPKKEEETAPVDNTSDKEPVGAAQ